MIDVTIKMTVSAAKRNEILHTIKDLLVHIRREQDCISCHCYLDVEVEDIVIFEQEWKNKEALEAHLRSGHFKVLLGAMKLLSIEPEITFNTVVATEGMEAIATHAEQNPTLSDA
ncbi:MAG: antibiotic biosynthesis monooxygenase [Desulfuromusa sp.]|jgi:quinol monooxygenase YgiN|nr:antibiotic biosynthesis monooxygenase [Desulfuromusa sp.]